jgi:subtilase family serine protease
MISLSPIVSKGFIGFALVLSLMLGASAESSAVTARQPLINGRIDETQLVTLPGNVRPEANASHDLGQVDDSMPLNHLQLVLVRPEAQESALDEYMQKAQTPGNPDYHVWLTAEEIGAKYGPDSHDIAAVRDWLELHGLQVNSVSASGLMIDFSGTAGQIAETFKTEIHSLDVNGERHISNMRNPQIPAALTPVVAGITSLNDFRPRPMMKPVRNSVAVSPQGPAAKPDYSEGGNYNLVAPPDLETIYNFNPVYKSGITGKGETVVVIEDTDLYSSQDYATFRKAFGLDSYTDSAFSVVHPGGCPDPGVAAGGTDFEATIDAEWAAAAAPDANIVLASCADTTDNFGGFIALQGLVDSHTPPAIVSISYGICEAALPAAFNRYISVLYQQAAAEGMSVYVAAGDEGAASCDADFPEAVNGIAVSGYASTPYNLAAGGTDFSDFYSGTSSQYWVTPNTATFGSAKSYIPEMPWNDSCASEPLFTYFGYATAYGESGFCNSEIGETYFLDVVAGSGGPSGCAYGATSPDIGTPAVSGTCRGYAKPIWQWFLAGVPNDGVRDIPDVSLFAATGVWGHYYVSCYSDPAYGGLPCIGHPNTWSGAGGTSFVSPILAGVQALLNQKTRSRQGNPDYAYYALATLEYGFKGNDACDSNNGTNECIFHDVTFGDNDVNCLGTFSCYDPSGPNGVLSVSSNQFDNAYGTTKGWDFATGIGSLNVDALVNAWARIY